MFRLSLLFIFILGIFQGFAQPKRTIQNEHYNDDFSHLLNDTIQKKGTDKLKYIALNKDTSVHISFGGELREWYEYRGNVNFGDLPPGFEVDNNGTALHRAMLHTDLWLKSKVRVFAQLNNTYEFGNPNDPIPEIAQDALGVHQFFAEIHPTKNMFFRLGRQELSFGNELLISSREGPNNRLAFDGASFLINTKKVKLHTFGATPVIINPALFDNEHINEYIWGTYAYLRTQKEMKLDAYYIGYHSDRRTYNLVGGTQNRHTIGSRIWHHDMHLNYELEGMYQTGKFNDLNINAFNIVGEVLYSFPVKWLPTIGLGGSYVSGDYSNTDNQLNTFDPLYPKPTFGLGVPLGPSNITNIRPIIGIRPIKGLIINASTYFLARASTQDASYAPSMDQVRPFPPTNSDKKGIGTQYALDIIYLPNDHWTFLSFMSYVTPTAYVKETGNGLNMVYFAIAGAYKF